MPFTFSYFRRSRSPLSHWSHYMNHTKIYPFSDDLCPQWALEATSYTCHIHLAARCTMFPHWALGATRLQHLFHLANSDVLVPLPLWAMGATIWTTSMSYTSSRSMHYVSPLSPGSHEASMPFTFSYFRRSRSPVSHWSHHMNHAKIYPFSDDLCPQWALGATSYQCHIHLAARCTMFPHWAPGATRLQRSLRIAISDVPGLLWAIGATIWTTSRSIHFQTFFVPNEPWEPLHINVLYI